MIKVRNRSWQEFPKDWKNINLWNYVSANFSQTFPKRLKAWNWMLFPQVKGLQVSPTELEEVLAKVSKVHSLKVRLSQSHSHSYQFPSNLVQRQMPGARCAGGERDRSSRWEAWWGTEGLCGEETWTPGGSIRFPSLRLTEQQPLRPNFPIFVFSQVTEEDIQAFMAERLARWTQFS